MEKINYTQYLELIRNPDTTDEELLSYAQVVEGSGAMDFAIVPNPEYVVLTDDDREFENALAIGNDIDRFRRRIRFKSATRKTPTRKVIVTEGDSWLNFPLIVSDVVDYLSKRYNVSCVSAAGDTLQNIVYGPKGPRAQEYLSELLKLRSEVDAFVLSAAGNDIIGEDPKTGRAALEELTKNFNGNENDIKGHINHAAMSRQLKQIRDAYALVINNIRRVPELKNLPIIIHGYDYAFPYPAAEGEHRNPIHVSQKDKWLGSAFKKRGIYNCAQQREIVRLLVDSLYGTLFEIAGNSHNSNVWVVDCRGAMPDVSLWIDEIHGNNAGFAKVSSRFVKVIDYAVAHRHSDLGVR